ncbi:hypothetical protein [Haloarchaeobius amylolyticus]|uniref:hypothetical protein n=1 Tax=Haloarchaeobius amylolyticus TaxID=1198296 RepID=UPI0022712161|nr:hypothetical protein [Haloarchaeobius amylolyticus]
MRARRQFLAGLATAGLAALAGCTNLGLGGGGGGVACSSRGSIPKPGPIGMVRAMADGSRVLFVVAVKSEAVENEAVVRLGVFDQEDGLVTDVPVMDNREENDLTVTGLDPGMVPYAIDLGRAPVHGWYRVVAYDGEGAVVGEAVEKFNCFVGGTV